MNALLLAAALVWPPECIAFGQLYYQAAQVRDGGSQLRDALRVVESRQARLALIHVYERRDMTPEAWRWMAVGICIAQGENKGEARGRPAAL